MPKTQSAASHAAWDPLFHFVLAPLVFLNLGLAVYCIFRAWPWQKHLHVGWILVSVILLLISIRLRTYTLRAQDRIIRLEEHLRLARLAPGVDFSRLSMRQLIALRFASDAELPALAARTLAEDLDSKAIKSSIAVWRPDYERV